MYDKFFLSNDQLNTIHNWFQSEKILFIYGSPGIGKTTLAKEILKNTVITVIDTLNLKNNIDYYDHILNIVRKKNITLMFDQSESSTRGLIIDNIDIFNKYDKRNFKSILRFLIQGKFYGTKLIVICNSKFINHRSIAKLKYHRLNLNYDKHLIHKIASNILKERKIQLSFDERSKLLFKSNFNFNSFLAILNDNKPINTSPLDNFDSSEKLYCSLFQTKYTLSDIIRLYDSEKITISLNLLENLIDYSQDININADILKNYEIADILDKQTIHYSSININTSITIFPIYLLVYNRFHNIMKYKNNKYISRCLINISFEKKNFQYKENNYLISMYLFLIQRNQYTPEIIDKLKKIDKKELDYFIKSFQYFYDLNIKNRVLKLIQSTIS